MLKVLIIFRKFLKFSLFFIICSNSISLTLLTELYKQDRNYRRTKLWLKERLQIIFPELLFLFYSKTIPQIVFENINNISCTDCIVSDKKKMFQFVDDELRTDIKNMMEVAPWLPLSLKTEDHLHQTDRHQSLWQALESSFCKTHIIQLQKCWSNIFSPFYKILFIWYLEKPFSLKNILCLVQNMCLFFIFRNMYYMGFIGKYWFILKTSINFPNFQKSNLGLKFEYI